MKSARPIRVAHIATIDLTVRVMLRRQLLRLRDEGFEVTAVSAPGPNTAALEADGIRHVPWNNATRAWDLGADVRAFAELVRILRRERFDVVHTHNAKPGVMGRVAARVAEHVDARFRRQRLQLVLEFLDLSRHGNLG